jgi:PPOX class probable F420-dependent enzyme
MSLSDDAKAMLREPYHGWVTTIRPDGSLHSTVVWVDLDGDDVIFNTAIGRAKERYLRGDGRVSISVLDPNDPFHALSVSGEGTLEEDGADAVIDRLAKKYLGVDTYPYRTPEERRITVRVTPERVIYSQGN